MYSKTTSHLSAPPPQADTIHGTDGNDSLLAGANGGLLFGHGGDDTLRGAIGGTRSMAARAQTCWMVAPGMTG